MAFHWDLVGVTWGCDRLGQGSCSSGVLRWPGEAELGAPRVEAWSQEGRVQDPAVAVGGGSGQCLTWLRLLLSVCSGGFHVPSVWVLFLC